jgi:hypothetical protein
MVFLPDKQNHIVNAKVTSPQTQQRNRMKPITSRPIPEGFTLEWDNTIWNVGHTFQWSDVFQQYMKQGTIAVKPGQTLPEAFQSILGEPMWPEYEIFFIK